jgi:hypothetical protein
MTVLTSLDFLKPGAKWPPDRERLERYATCKLLMEGDHDLVFTGLNEDDAPRIIKMRLNWFKRICTLIADLAVGAPPRTTADQQDTIDRITASNSFDVLIYDLFIDVVKFGNGLLKPRWDGARGVISRIDPKIWFPVVSPDDTATFTHHVLAWEVKKSDDKYIKVEIHEPGKITHKLLKLASDSKEIENEVPLDTIERFAELKEEEATGVSGFLVVPFSNLRTGDGVFGADDFKDIADLVEEIERRLVKVSGTLDVFADPWMCGPPGLRVRDPLTGEVVWASDEKYIALGEGERNPEILTWDAEMEATFRQIDTLLSQLYVMAELSPAAFGETKNGLAESGSALKRLMLPTLSKVSRLRLRIKPQLLEALRITSELETSARMTGAQKLTGLNLEWRSALPADPIENANVEKTRREAGISSRRSSVARTMEGASADEIDAEVQRIEEEEDLFKREIMV